MKQKCCRNIFKVGQHPIDGADGTTDGTKLQFKQQEAAKPD